MRHDSGQSRRKTAKSISRTPRTLAAGESAASLPLEANVILIAHPDNLLLGSRFRLLRGGSLEIGRSAGSDISLPDVPSVSRHHALLRFDDEVTLRDLGSTNGTVVEDRVLHGTEALRSGTRFQTGAVHFKLLLDDDVEHAYHLAVYEMMMRDGLTGLFNRRKFSEEADRECARARRYARPLALILFDVDHFKQVNDRYGHLRGDAVLQKIAAAVSELTRTEQVVARIGGEEFAILCPEVNAAGAAVLAERIREKVAALEHEDGTRRFQATISLGIAEWGDAFEDQGALLAAADAALYRSKEGGRNRVTVA